jgi:hypothetical protein
MQKHAKVKCAAVSRPMQEKNNRASSLQVTKTTYSGLQEHRIIKNTATGQNAKPKVRMSTETTDTGNSSKTPEACRREAEEHKLKSAVEHRGAQIEQARPLEATVEHQQAEGAQLLTNVVPVLLRRAIALGAEAIFVEHTTNRQRYRPTVAKCTRSII